jgi:hypothetical protein
VKRSALVAKKLVVDVEAELLVKANNTLFAADMA